MTTARAETEIILNAVQTPDDVGAFFLDDLSNSGQVASGPKERIAVLKDNPAMNIGDVGNENTPGRIRKAFLLFRLPDLEGKSVKKALLNLFFSDTEQEGPAPLPPLFLLHANQWDADAWESDALRRGLQLSDYGDVEKFSTKKEVSGPDQARRTPVSIDVTEMIKADYERGARPVAAFRLEVGDQQSWDIMDELYNSYVFAGPGRSHPEATPPSLSLIVE